MGRRVRFSVFASANETSSSSLIEFAGKTSGAMISQEKKEGNVGRKREKKLIAGTSMFL